jgi:thermolysin
MPTESGDLKLLSKLRKLIDFLSANSNNSSANSKPTKRPHFLGRTSTGRWKVRTAFVAAVAIIAGILIVTQIRDQIVIGQELPSITVGEVPLPVNLDASSHALFQNGSADEIATAKEISLRILNKQLRNRNVGTVSELKVEKVEIDDLQMAHTRVQQTFGGIPVWEGEAIVHLKADGSLFAITDNLKESISVNTQPSFSPPKAVRIAGGLYRGAAKQSETPKVELWIYRGETQDHLTYRVRTPRIDGSNDPAIPIDFIDAHTGERVFGYNDLQNGTGSSLYSGTVSIGTSSVGSSFFMENLTRKVGTFDFNNTTTDMFRLVDSDDVWNSTTQRAGVDAQYGAEATMNYYQSVHSRNGIDGSGGPGYVAAAANSSIGLISSFVHYGNSYNNAFWNGSYMTYGDGDGSTFSPLVTLDICGHEMTHGVTERTAGLVYAKEPGALNESMSDVFGTMVERSVRPSTWNWKIGEDAFTPGVPGDALRLMDNPHAIGDPDHYSLRLYPGACVAIGDGDDPGYNDNCGVHTNSSISNHAFYLIAAGGTNRVSGITVPGIGPDNAARIWYRALTSYMTSSTDFAGARQATLNAATAIFGASSSQYNSVATGWCAVGVGVCPGSGGGCSAAAITVGQTVNGSLSTSDCVFTGTTRRVDLYSFSGTAGQQIAVSMSSSVFDTYLYLANSSNQTVGEDDDGGDGFNSRIPATSGFITLPATGTYTIYATSYAADSLGTYSLTLSAGGSCPATPISVGQTTSASLTTSDCIFSGTNRYVDLYSFNGSAGQRVGVSMSSSSFDTYLYLVNSSNQIIGEDDDGGGGTNSRIPATTGFVTLPATGSYRIQASSFSAGSTGAYTISLIAGVSPPSAPTANAATSVTASSFTANWGGSSGATGYRLDVSTSNTFSSFVSGYQNLDVGNFLSRSVTGLASGTSYFYRLRAYNTGGNSGNSGTVTATTSAGTVQVTVQTNPAGRSFVVDSTTYSSAQTFTWVRGSSHTIATTSPQNGSSGVRFSWNNWSNGGAISHSVAPTANISYTANFTTQYFLSMNAGTGGTVSPSSNWFNSGQAVSITASPSSGFSFNGWTGSGSGSFSGSANPASVTMGGPLTESANFINTPATVRLTSGSYSVSESGQLLSVSVTRSGNTSSAASVAYATSDGAGTQNCNVANGKASSRCDYISAVGALTFAAGETTKTINILIVNDSYPEGTETLAVSLSSPSGATLASPSTASVSIGDNESAPGANPIEQAGFFVTEHYYDFLNRQADAGGLAFWTNEITSCGSNQACAALKRINVSGAYFLSIEFQQTGYLVERLYRTAYGSGTGTSTFGGPHQIPVPIVRFSEFLPDVQQISRGIVVGDPGADQLLEARKQAVIAEFVLRSRFITAFPVAMTPTQFVDKLNTNAGNPLSATQRTQLINELTSGVKTRGQVLRAVAEDPDLFSAETNRAFVLMQYFGYLRRNPNDTPDADYTGYDFWLTKLNQFNGNFVNAEMVKAFITSGEYRQRFGP